MPERAKRSLRYPPACAEHQVSNLRVRGLRVSSDGSHDFFPVRFATDGFGGSQEYRGFNHRLHRKTICQWHILFNPFLSVERVSFDPPPLPLFQGLAWVKGQGNRMNAMLVKISLFAPPLQG
jgi:hypothetical protein